jgi:hypothetical protein
MTPAKQLSKEQELGNYSLMNQHFPNSYPPFLLQQMAIPLWHAPSEELGTRACEHASNKCRKTGPITGTLKYTKRKEIYQYGANTGTDESEIYLQPH